MFCPKCGTENLNDAKFCKKCGENLEEMKVTIPGEENFLDRIPFIRKIPGFRSKTPWKMVLASIGYPLIAILIVLSFAFIFISTNVAINVNSAIYVDNIGEIYPIHGRFLVMNTSIENKGNDLVTVSAYEFAPKIGDYYVWDYSVFYGGNTDLRGEIEIPGGENRTFLLVFDIGNETPDSLRYASFWDPLAEPINASMVPMTVPFDGMHANYNIKGEINDKPYEQRMEVNYDDADPGRIKQVENHSCAVLKNAVQPDPGRIKQVENWTVISPPGGTIWLTDTVYITFRPGTFTTTLDPITLLDEDGLHSYYFNHLTVIGDSVDNVDPETGEVIGTATLERSETIEIMGKKIDCWVTESTMTLEGITIKETRYYDKTTDLLLKTVRSGSGTVYGVSVSRTSTWILTETNMPLIGVLS